MLALELYSMRNLRKRFVTVEPVFIPNLLELTSLLYYRDKVPKSHYQKINYFWEHDAESKFFILHGLLHID